MEDPHERPDVQAVDAAEFHALLVSRRSLERLQPHPRPRQPRPVGLRDRRTGVIYVRSGDVDGPRVGAGPLLPAGAG